MGRISFVHFLGSRPRGAYQRSTATDPYVDTEPCMDLAWRTYVTAYGLPDILQLHFAT